MNPKDKAQLDQSAAALKELMPTMWWAVYSGCVNKGFTPDQAIKLTVAYIQSTNKPYNSGERGDE